MLPLFFYFQHGLKNLSFSVKRNAEVFASISTALWCGVQGSHRDESFVHNKSRYNRRISLFRGLSTFEIMQRYTPRCFHEDGICRSTLNSNMGFIGRALDGYAILFCNVEASLFIHAKIKVE